MTISHKTSSSYEHIETADQVRSLLLDRYDTFLVDCDGVLWHDNEPIEGAMETLSLLQNKLQKRVVFVTNSSVRSREQYCDKFNTIMSGTNGSSGPGAGSEDVKVDGFTVDKRQMFCSAYLTALHLRAHNIGTREGRLVYVVGESGLEEELRQTGGVNVLTHADAMREIGVQVGDANSVTLSSDQILGIPDELLERIDAVVVGWDREFTFSKLSFAAACILGNPQCKFIATNNDAFDMVGERRYVPGNGAMVGAIEASTGKRATILAKPEPWLVQEIMDEYGIADRSRIVMVGDRLDTDILLGKRAGIDTLLVMTGCTSREQITTGKLESDLTPTLVINALGDIARHIAPHQEHVSR